MIDIYGIINHRPSNGDTPTAQYEADDNKVVFWGQIFNGSAVDNPAQLMSDTYARHGLCGLGRIDGHFMAIITTAQSTIIIRDRHGIYSQLYYTAKYYATSLRRLCNMQPGLRPDEKALATFLASGIIPTPHSALAGVNKLPAGHAMVIDQKGNTSIVALDDYGDAPDIPQDEAAMAEQYGNLHIEAIRRRIGNNPTTVGMLLSGGYDSGSNLAALRKFYNGEIRTYSIGFKGDTWTELPLARIMSERFGTIHSEYEIDGSEILDLPKIVATLGDPFVEGGLVVNYAAMRLAGSDHLPVILGGDGSDQYFGTAGRELALYRLTSQYGMMPMLKCGLSALNLFGLENCPRLFKLRFRLASICNVTDDLFGFKCNPRRIIPAASMIYSTSFKPDNSSWDALYRQHRLRVDIQKTIDQIILFKASRMADMMGNNMAFPFTDLQLRKYLDALPTDMMCHSGGNLKEMAKGNLTSKYLLKKLYKPLLPTEITSKKKQGGFAPMPLFFADDHQRRRLADFIMSSAACNELLNRQYIEKFLRNYDAMCHDMGIWFWQRQNEALKYFYLLSLATWWEIYVKNTDVTL